MNSSFASEDGNHDLVELND